MISLRSPVKTNRGQGITEFALTTFLGGVLVVLGLQFAYYSWAKLWLRHVLYETLICEMQNESDCESQAKRLINRYLPFQNHERPPQIRLQHRRFKYSGRIRVDLNGFMYAEEGTTLDRPEPIGGFVYLSFLIPLAVTILVSFSLAALVINERAKQFQICRDKVLDANQKVEDGIQSILGLNNRVLMLQIQRDALETAARSDPEPYSQAMIQAAIQRNQIQQVMLTNQQRVFKQSALAFSRVELAQMRMEATTAGATALDNSRPKLDLESELTWHTAKRQSRSFDFSDRHKILARWTVSTSKFDSIFKVPEYLNQRLHILCASTIRRVGGKWIPMPATP